MRGWQLPQRAKLRAEPGDLFIPHVWGCAGKWFIASGNCEHLVITNGCTRLRFKDGKAKDSWPDIAAGLCSEAFRVQMRAFATGSDGLAEISDEDLLSVILPRLTSADVRKRVAARLAPILEGDPSFGKAVQNVLDGTSLYPGIAPRKSHCSVV
jgi:type I restriction enzyme M protein